MVKDAAFPYKQRRQLPQRLFIKALSVPAVSYTHLDVYKRQLCAFFGAQFQQLRGTQQHHMHLLPSQHEILRSFFIEKPIQRFCGRRARQPL